MSSERLPEPVFETAAAGAAVGLPEGVPAALAGTAARSARLEIALVWAASRLLVLLCAALVQLTGFPRASRQPGFLEHPFAVLTTGDGRWYRIIAEHGYLLIPQSKSDPAFFPLLPILLRALHSVGIPLDVTGLVLANGCFLVGLVALYELGQAYLPEADARRAAVFAALVPSGFAFSMVYPESLAFASLALAGLFAVRRRWLAVLPLAALAAFARPQGVLIALPLAAIAWRSWPTLSSSDRARASAAVLAPIATLAAIAAYFWATLGDPLAWTVAQRAWGRSFGVTGPVHALVEVVTSPMHSGKVWLIRDAIFCAVFIACILLARRAGVPRGWTAMGLAVVLLPIASGSFTSDARFGLLALPVYWGLAVAARRKRAEWVLLAAFPILLAAGVFTITLRSP